MYLRGQSLPVSYTPQTTTIYDANGEVIDSLFNGQNRDVVPLDQISPHLIKATLAIEDHRFFDHYGIDFRGLARAVVTNVQQMNKSQGASTITQQLARNLYLTHEKTWNRKLKEAAYAVQLEMQYSKEEILEKYLNQIYYGHAAYGIEAAARMYFAKPASELTLAESALLAGVPKGPYYYSPYMNEANAISRQQLILDKMVEVGLITQREAEEAKQEPLTFQKLERSAPAEAPYFRDYVRHVAVHELGIDEQMFEEGGLAVYTTLDLHVQRIAEQAVRDQLGNSELQAALVAIDPRNGYVRAMVGGKNYAENQYNRVFAETRQPGSSFKPFVYLTALETNAFTPMTKYLSQPTSFTYDEGRNVYQPSNFGNRYPNKEIDMREAISKSDNIYAVHTILDVGAEQVIETARRLGIESPMQPLPSLALGTFPVSPFEMASAFSAFANGGVRYKPVAITRIEDSTGQVLYEAESVSEQVVEPAYAYVLTHLMQSIFSPGGTGSRVASMLKRPVAGKTGTTDSDAWMVGYTPELATAVWVGYDQGRTISATETHLAAPIFAAFTEQALEAVPPKLFPVPDGVVSVYVDPATGKLAGPDCPDPRAEVFVQGTEPTEICMLHHPHDAEPEPPAEQPDPDRSWWEDVKRWWSD
ncbi:penicillin-binding protein [Xylanibacillus composti]|uniref:Penicillin-binding protein n=1 Tax=Xylanibacillus composti TaxID=1572762 RepID=A0A8J4M0W2_9BACL|nr:penicillin-binding protein [Xylanibacillus composti]